MIHSADEFVRLRNSANPEEYALAATDVAALNVWQDVISRFPDMKEWVVHNKTVPIDILAVLASDESTSIRAAVADKRKLTTELFDLLSRDRDEPVRQRIAYNRKTPKHLLVHLSIDPSPLVRAVAIERMGRTDSQ